MNVRPYVAQNLTRNRGRSAIGGRTTRHPGHAASQRIRKRIEEGFDEGGGRLHWRKLSGVERVGGASPSPQQPTAAAYNLVRLPKLLAAPT